MRSRSFLCFLLGGLLLCHLSADASAQGSPTDKTVTLLVHGIVFIAKPNSTEDHTKPDVAAASETWGKYDQDRRGWTGMIGFLESQGYRFGGILGTDSNRQITRDDRNATKLPADAHFFSLLFSEAGNAEGITVRAVELKRAINWLRANTGCRKVRIVAHSAGGIVARAYVQGRAEKDASEATFEHDVDRLITICTPHLGAAVASQEIPWIGAKVAHMVGLRATSLEPNTSLVIDLSQRYELPADVDFAAIAARSIGHHSDDGKWIYDRAKAYEKTADQPILQALPSDFQKGGDQLLSVLTQNLRVAACATRHERRTGKVVHYACVRIPSLTYLNTAKQRQIVHTLAPDHPDVKSWVWCFLNCDKRCWDGSLSIAERGSIVDLHARDASRSAAEQAARIENPLSYVTAVEDLRLSFAGREYIDSQQDVWMYRFRVKVPCAFVGISAGTAVGTGTLKIKVDRFGRVQQRTVIDLRTENIERESSLDAPARGFYYSQNGLYEDAVQSYRLALDSGPDSAEIKRRLSDAALAVGKARLTRADYAGGLEYLEQAHRTSPTAQTADALAWALATCPDPKFRDGKRAVECAKQACDSTKRQNGLYLSTLAAAYAELGDFESAISTQADALRLSGKGSDLEAAEFRGRLKGYKAKQPFRSLLPGEAASRIVEILGPALPELIGLLKTGSAPEIREKAARTLADFGAQGAWGPRAPQAVRALADTLADKRQPRNLRTTCARALGWGGVEVDTAVPALITALSDQDYDVRISAAYGLGDLSPKSNRGFGALRDALNGEELSLRQTAAWALGRMPSEGKQVVPLLLEAITDSDKGVRVEAIGALANFPGEAPTAVPALVRALEDPESYVRVEAAKSIHKLTPPDETDSPALDASIVALQALLKDTIAVVRSNSASALGSMEFRARGAAPALVTALGDSDSFVRWEAALALVKTGAPSKAAAVPELMAALKDTEITYRRQKAAEALGKIGPEAVGAIPAMAAALSKNGGNFFERQAVIVALGRIGRSAHAAVPALIGVLQEKGSFHRSDAAETLGKIGPGAKSAVPALLAALKDDNTILVASAVQALAQIGPEGVPEMVTALNDQENAVRRVKVAEALGLMGPGAKEAVPSLIEAMKDKEPYVRQSAAQTLRLIGPAAKPAALVLRKDLTSKDAEVRLTAAATLLATGAEAEAAAQVLIDDVQRRGLTAANAIAVLMESIGPQAEAAAPALRDALNQALTDGDQDQSLVFAVALGNIGSGAKIAVPPLEKAFGRTDVEIRSAAAFALWRIDQRQAAMTALIKQLEDTRWTNRDLAAELLGRVGPEAKAAVPALINAAKNGQRSALEALLKIDPASFRKMQRT